MRRRAIFYLATAFAALSAPAARAADQPAYPSGPWHFRSISCMETTVAAVAPRVMDSGDRPPYSPGAFKNTGVIVTFASGLGVRPVFPKESAAVVHYEGDATNDIMIAEKPGDRVQLCFLGGPAPTSTGNAPGACDPDTDPRGRQYRVWDYAQSKQYSGFNAEHLCGGA